MKKIAIFAALLALTGCVTVGNYSDVVKASAPSGLVGYWQSAGPQSALPSPDAIASLIITPQGDTLDCRQWQRVITQPGKLMKQGDDLYNVTQKLDLYTLEQSGKTLKYDHMTLKRVDKPTQECAEFLARHPLASH